MKNMYKLDKNDLRDPIIKRVLEASFPGYTGRNITIELTNTFRLDQSWFEGSRTTWRAVTRDGKLLDPGLSFSSGIFNNPIANQFIDIPVNTIIVQHIIFQGKDLGLYVLIRPDEFNKDILPITEDINEYEKIVLEHTRSLKSSYGGIKNYRFYEANRKTNITLENWNNAIETCITKGLLAKNKAITPKGYNAISGGN